MNVSDNTPILVGAGQYVERKPTESSPMHIAASAAQAALAATGGSGVVQAIDTIAVIKIFSDSSSLWATEQGRSNNPPQSIARVIGANPEHRIYSETGGNEPQSLLFEFFADLAAGRKDMVLLAGSEAIKNQRNAKRNGLTLDWEENFDEPLEDRGFGKFVANNQEISNGMVMPLFYYILIEQARRLKLGMDKESYLADTARMLEEFSAVASRNPYSMFPTAMSAEEILSAAPLTDLYTKRMIAQDSVNLGAALLLTTVGKARELGIEKGNWVYLHGGAQGMEVDLTIRPDPSTSEMATRVVDQALNMAGKSADEMSLVDIYSCFPCVPKMARRTLGWPVDRPATVFGGLTFGGGPIANYMSHAVVSMVEKLRKEGRYGFLFANGGFATDNHCIVLGKEPIAAASFPQEFDYQAEAEAKRGPVPDLVEDYAGPATIESYTIFYGRDGAPRAGVVVARTPEGRRTLAHVDVGDAAMLAFLTDGKAEPVGAAGQIVALDEGFGWRAG